MQPTPEICKHKGILTHWKDYPVGSIERAKSIGLEVWFTSKSLDTTLSLWQTELSILQREKPWKALGLKSADDFVKAVIGRTTKEIGKEITKRTRIQELRSEHPDWTQQQIADEVGVTKQYVNQIESSKSSQEEEAVDLPEHIEGNSSKADFRKLPEELRNAVAEKKISLNAAAIKAGIRKKLSHAEKCVAAFRKAENRLEVLSIQLGELEECELIVLKEMVEDQLANK